MAATTSQSVLYLSLPVAASTSLESQQHVAYNGSGDIVAATDASGLVYAGITNQAVNNTGAAGAVNANVIPPGVNRYHLLAASGADKSWHGKLASFVDSATVALATTTTNDIAAGRVIRVVSATQVVVDTADRFTIPAAA